MCFTPMQHREFVQFRPAQVFTLMPQAFNRIEFAFCAVENGADTQMVMLVNLVDVETHELTYDLRLPVGRAAQKKISYSNPWDQPQTIMLRSSAPKLLVPREPVLQLPTSQDIYLFINDKRTDQNEECLLFQVTYH
ncbi:hypothetical protein GN244_ATG20310 [Phytophthora infestans]|uniref:NPHP4 Ig-like domain-containing protein n=1 Tax=Phytophthora infestans TaxID=4787 RepID=A0A833SH65_PHYIN|nr:hypothetical protein GN244_ATG20310 [Phytophthora infestans]